MTYDEIFEGKEPMGIDDVQHAHSIMSATLCQTPEFRVLGLAKMLAQLRANYIEIGRAVEANAQNTAGLD